jgi:hypothetical protein
MMIEIPPIGALIFPNDTQWALAAKVPTAVLDAARSELSDFLQGEGSRVIRGNKGMSVLLVFGGSLGVLDIPRHMLLPDGGGAAAGSQSPSPGQGSVASRSRT